MNEMQITLNQAEIETAIREYINKRMTLQDGVQIVLDLKATRGPEGFTASMEIVEPGAQAATQSEETPPPVPQPRKPRQTIASQATQTQPDAEVPKAPDPAQDNAGDAQAETAAADTSTDAEANSGSEDGQEQAAEDPPAPTAPPKSLFGNLQRPKNT